MRHLCPALLLCLVGLLAGRVRAAELPDRYLAAKDVKRGMTGYGLSVFHGTKVERFQVEVLGVLRNRKPKQDMILIRMKGAGLETTGVIAGMSGSPIYLEADGEHKLAGAVAYGWSFPKEPVCGVTPIENMHAVAASALAEERPEGKQAAGGRLDQPIRLGHRTFTDVRIASAPAPWDAMTGRSAVLHRLRTPLTVSGLTEPALSMLREAFEPYGFLPVQGGGRGAAPADRKASLQPGSAVAVMMAEGDITMSGGGTVTDVTGERVLAFGHPMFGEGRVNVPIATASVELSFASVVRSFKMTAPIQKVGRFTVDAQAAVAGRLGEAPRMIPVEARLRRSDIPGEETFQCRVFNHPRMTPRIVASFLVNSLTLRGGFPEQNTVSYRAVVHLDGQEPLVLENVYTGLDDSSAIKKAFAQIVQPIATLLDNPLGAVPIERIEAEFDVEGTESSAAIEAVRLESNEVRPGETIRAYAVLRPHQGEPTVKPIELELPEDFPPGKAKVNVCDAATAEAKHRSEAPHLYRAQTREQLVDILRRQEPHRRLFIRVERPGRGIARGSVELPALPASAFNVIASKKTTGLAATKRALVAHVDTAFVLEGNHVLPILVRPRQVR